MNTNHPERPAEGGGDFFSQELEAAKRDPEWVGKWATGRSAHAPTVESLTAELERVKGERDEARKMLTDYLNTPVGKLVSQARDDLTKAREAWDWLDVNKGVELSWGDNRYQDEGEAVWRLHRRFGSVNNQEWLLITEGETPLAVVRAALAQEGGEG